jgi:hypothetical protein
MNRRSYDSGYQDIIMSRRSYESVLESESAF